MEVLRVSRCLLISLVLLLSTGAAQGQITLDGSMGPAGALAGPNYTIPSSVGQTRGSNLFHSFGLFNLQTNQSATFTGPTSISNIFGRVTGGQPSNIDGTLRSTIPNASLYLMNPAGMVFGPNAFLDVRGSFHATTADYLKFADGARFHTNLSRQSTLTTAPVSAFGFLNQNPAGILVQQTALQTPPRTTLSLVGGDIDVIGDPFFTAQGKPTLSTFGGTLQLASVAAPGEVPHNVQDLNPSQFQRMGNISLFNAAYLEVANFNGGAPGNIIIRGGQLIVDNSLVSADNVGGASGVSSSVDVLLSRDAAITNGSFVTADSFASGHAANVNVTADTLTVDDSLIRSKVFSSGKGGDVRVTARSIMLNRSEISADTAGRGDSGTIAVHAGNLTLSGGAIIASDTLGRGNGGALQITADETLTLAGGGGFIASAQPGSSGNAGSITVSAKNLIALGGSQIFGGTFETGNGATVLVTVAEDIKLDGIGLTRDGLPPASGIASGANPGSTGNAGSITIRAGNLAVTGGAQISSSTFGTGDGGNLIVAASKAITIEGSAQAGPVTINSSISASNQPDSTGNAGSILLETNDLTMARGAQLATSTFGPGNSGDIRVVATGNVMLTGRDQNNFSTTISSGSGPGSSGAPGDIVMQTGNVTVAGGAQISSSTQGSKKGGAVQIAARDTILVDGVGTNIGNGTGIMGSGIIASTEATSDAAGGDILLTAKNVTVRGAQILSGTFGAGDGGTIHIVADAIELGGFGFDLGQGLKFQGGIAASNQPGSIGKAGNILLDAGRIRLVAGAALASQTFGPQRGGNIVINAEAVELHEDSTITGTSKGIGNAGDIFVRAGAVRMKASSISTSADFADGGNIHLEVGKLVELVNSRITTSVQGGAGAGGNITIDPQFVVLNNSRISANAFGGPGGNIRIVADNFLASPDSTITASSALSTPGTVDIQAQIADLTGSLAALPEGIVQATSLLRQSCATRYGSGKLSSLAAAGRGGMPFEPGSFFMSAMPESSDASISPPNAIAVSRLMASRAPLFSLVPDCGVSR